MPMIDVHPCRPGCLTASGKDELASPADRRACSPPRARPDTSYVRAPRVVLSSMRPSARRESRSAERPARVVGLSGGAHHSGGLARRAVWGRFRLVNRDRLVRSVTEHVLAVEGTPYSDADAARVWVQLREIKDGYWGSGRGHRADGGTSPAWPASPPNGTPHRARRPGARCPGRCRVGTGGRAGPRWRDVPGKCQVGGGRGPSPDWLSGPTASTAGRAALGRLAEQLEHRRPAQRPAVPASAPARSPGRHGLVQPGLEARPRRGVHVAAVIGAEALGVLDKPRPAAGIASVARSRYGKRVRGRAVEHAQQGRWPLDCSVNAARRALQ